MHLNDGGVQPDAGHLHGPSVNDGTRPSNVHPDTEDIDSDGVNPDIHLHRC